MEHMINVKTFKDDYCPTCKKTKPSIVLVIGGKHQLTLCEDCEKELFRFLVHRALNEGRI